MIRFIQKRVSLLKRYLPASSDSNSENSSNDVNELTFVVLDTETTGLNPEIDRVLSIGALKLKAGRIKTKEALELYIHQKYFDATAVPIHGLLKSTRDTQKSEQEGITLLRDYIGDALIVGHHIRFDIEIINRALLRSGLPKLTNSCLDTALLYRKTLLKSPFLKKKDHYSLDDLAKRFNLSCRDRHTALGDAYITAMAFLHILRMLSAKGSLTRKKILNWGVTYL